MSAISDACEYHLGSGISAISDGCVYHFENTKENAKNRVFLLSND